MRRAWTQKLPQSGPTVCFLYCDIDQTEIAGSTEMEWAGEFPQHKGMRLNKRGKQRTYEKIVYDMLL